MTNLRAYRGDGPRKGRGGKVKDNFSHKKANGLVFVKKPDERPRTKLNTRCGLSTKSRKKNRKKKGVELVLGEFLKGQQPPR